MNCLVCGTPLPFGATLCGCGFDNAPHKNYLETELAWWEALCAYWRIWWPPHLVAAILFLVVGALARDLAFRLPQRPYSAFLAVILLSLWPALLTLAQIFFIGRLTSRPYQSFRLAIVPADGSPPSDRLPLPDRVRIWYFLWWRQIAIAFLFLLLAALLHAIFGFGPLLLIPTILLIGPIVIKMLVGHQFRTFRLEARTNPGAIAEF